MSHIKLFEDFINESKSFNEAYTPVDRVLTPAEVKKLEFKPEIEKEVLSLLPKMKAIRAKYDSVVAKIADLIEKRDANKGKDWDKYQPEIQKLAGERDNLEDQKDQVQDELSRKIRVKRTGQYFFYSFHKNKLNESSTESISESIYPTSKGGKIESWGKQEEIGRMNLKFKGDIIGTLLVWMKPGYDFNTKDYDENYWEIGASYTNYPLDRYNGSTGSGVWSSSGYKSKDDAIKAGKEFMKNVKLG